MIRYIARCPLMDKRLILHMLWVNLADTNPAYASCLHSAGIFAVYFILGKKNQCAVKGKAISSYEGSVSDYNKTICIGKTASNY